jgi:hypothetical protein
MDQALISMFPRTGFRNLIRHFVVIATMPALAQGPSTRNLAPVKRSKASGRPFTATLTDISATALPRVPIIYGGERTKRYILEANGSGVAFLDFDNDGRLDIFVVNGSRMEGFARGQEPTNHLYRNAGSGRFQDVTRAAGVARSGWGSGVCVGDFDNDGYDDMYVTYLGRSVLYRNTGHGGFEDVTEQAGVAGSGDWSTGCTFVDYDRDSRLDLLVTRYQQFDPARTPAAGSLPTCMWKGMPVFCGPRGLPFGGIRLYHNLGGGRFEDATERSGVGRIRNIYPFTAVAADLNDDGWTDVYIACDSSPSVLLRNNRDGTFSDVGTQSGVAYSEDGAEQGGMGVALGDFDNDGHLDIVKTNFADDYPNVYRNLGRGIFEDVALGAGLGVNPMYVGWGVGLVDFDNDGWRDIFQVNGHVYPELDNKAGGERYRNPRLLYRNLGRGAFEDVTDASGPGVTARFSSRGAAFGDFDNDGGMDVLIMNMGDPPSLLHNQQRNTNHWVKVKLQGVRSNRSAIGAAVTIEAGGLRQTDAVVSQSSFLSRNDSRLHFGLGSADRIDSYTVRWPDGTSERFPGSTVDTLVLLVEGSGKTAVQDLPK